METYTSSHSETVEQLLDWPWQRFDAFYNAFMKRKLVEGLERRKDDMIAALYCNSNYDDGKDTRKNAIAEIEQAFATACEQILEPEPEVDEEEDDKFGFFEASKRGQQKWLHKVPGVEPDMKVAEVVSYGEEVDQDG